MGWKWGGVGGNPAPNVFTCFPHPDLCFFATSSSAHPPLLCNALGQGMEGISKLWNKRGLLSPNMTTLVKEYA